MAKQIITKRCSKCKEIKLLSEFHKDQTKKDFHRPDCKVCNLKRGREYFQTEQGKASRIRYCQSEKKKATKKRFCIRHPEQWKAENALNYAVRTGKLPRPDSLQRHYCDLQAKEYHHYLGYASKYWLDVIPVCIKCHSLLSHSNLMIKLVSNFVKPIFS